MVKFILEFDDKAAEYTIEAMTAHLQKMVDDYSAFVPDGVATLMVER